MEPSLAVVIPIFDEAESIEPLHREIDAALASLGRRLEIIWVDDGSRDRTPQVLRDLVDKDDRVRVVRLDRNRGQSAALDAGFRMVRAPVIVTLDGDLQNDPADIPMLLRHLQVGVDVVNGVRTRRRDPRLKILSSRIANAVRNRVLGESVSDVGCSLRVMRTNLVRRIDLYPGMHRFLPTLLQIEGARIVEVPVSHRPRRYGVSKYGVWKRLFAGLVDLAAVRGAKRRSRRGRSPNGGTSSAE